MPHRAVAIAACIAGMAVAGRAQADGVYAAESLGVSAGHGRLAQIVGGAFRMRLGLGVRLGSFAIEPWLTTDLQTDRAGGFKGVLGGKPSPGLADLTEGGLDGKYIVALDSHMDVFIRGGPLIIDGNGALDGYHGLGFGGGVGAQLSGQVRALGFLWAPFFFMKQGPMVTGALFLDVGYDAAYLRMAGAAPIDAGVSHVSIGFAIGSAF